VQRETYINNTCRIILFRINCHKLHFFQAPPFHLDFHISFKLTDVPLSLHALSDFSLGFSSTNLLGTRREKRNNLTTVGIHNSLAFISSSPFSFHPRISLLKNVLRENRRRHGFHEVGMRGCFVELNST